jgi:hypothetical protein
MSRPPREGSASSWAGALRRIGSLAKRTGSFEASISGGIVLHHIRVELEG